jgi:hypothetical protein
MNIKKKNPSIPLEKLEHPIESLKKIMNRPIGVIELGHDLEIETVTEIFIRINSAGVPLNQADFAMSKIASNEIYGGNQLRKSIDYFCHLARAPEFYENIKKFDSEFVKTESFQKISWLKDEIDDLYDPSYSDLLRVAFTSQFNRGQLSDLVNLLSGRNFETREYEAGIAEESFEKLRQGVYNFSKEDNFKKFLMIIRSAGFTSRDLVRSKSTLNFAYVLFLKLKAQNVNPSNIERFVRKWFVMSILTERYSSSPESQFDYDIRNISTGDFRDFFNEIEAGNLSDAFWETTLIQKLRTPVASSPYFNLFLAALIKLNHKGFLSRDITVHDMIALKGDIHHIFPKEYLKPNGYKREEYNQIANYAMTQQEINIKIGKKSPKDYLSVVLNQCKGATPVYGGIDDINTFRKPGRKLCARGHM